MNHFLPDLYAFLANDLGSVLLPPLVETKRQALVERLQLLNLDLLSAPSLSSIATSLSSGSNSCTVLTAAPAITTQRRPLSTVARLFPPSNKRFSLPLFVNYPQITEEADGSTENAEILSEPPLPPRGTHYSPPSVLYPDYEVPKNILSGRVTVTKADSLPSSTISDSSSFSRVRHPFARLSLSPQLEIIHSTNQNNRVGCAPSVCTGSPTTAPTPRIPCDSRHPPPPSSAISNNEHTLILPKKCLSNQSRRFSAITEPTWTLVGPLHHRYKPNKWTRLNWCLLTAGFRLIAYKSTHALNHNLSVFLCGASALYAGRDSGMDHVIKIALSTGDTTVLAADTEEQALIWIRQINQYAQGVTPTKFHSFLEQPSLSSSNHSSSISNFAVVMTTGNHLTSFSTTVATVEKSDEVIEPPNSNDLQEDSGFSAPLSSGSEGNSADGTVGCPSNATEISTGTASVISIRPDHLPVNTSGLAQSQLYKGNDDPMMNTPLTFISESSLVTPTSDHASLIKSTLNSMPSYKSLQRREGLLSSMRRKMESFSSRHRGRKSLHQSQLDNSSVTEYSGSLRGIKKHKRTVSDVPCDLIETAFTTADNSFTSRSSQMAPVAALLRKSSTFGFDWIHLQAAGTFLLHSNASISHLTGRNNRPRSALIHQFSHSSLSSSSRLDFDGPELGKLIDLDPPSTSSMQMLDNACSVVKDDHRPVISGEAFISVPGRVPWTSRWCSLRSHFLDIYRTSTEPVVANNSDPNHWPVFSLRLTPGLVELGLAGDKRRTTALRLAVPSQCTSPLLFDVPDKLLMGTWIRGFIDALGLIPPTPVPPSARSHHSVNERRSLPPTNSMNHSELIDPDQNRQYDVPASSELDLPQSFIAPQATSPSKREKTRCHSSVFTETTTFTLNSSPTSSTFNLYDEVCTSNQFSSPAHSAKTATNFQQRRWSTPGDFNAPTFSGPQIFITYNRNGFESSSNNEAQVVGDRSLPCTPLASSFHQNSWYVPPPSRRLLAEPLPPLPSIGPSTAGSMTGTMSSSHASASLTPDEPLNGFGRSDRISNTNLSEPEQPTTSFLSRDHGQLISSSDNPRLTPFSVASRRHASLSDLNTSILDVPSYATRSNVGQASTSVSKQLNKMVLVDSMSMHDGYPSLSFVKTDTSALTDGGTIVDDSVSYSSNSRPSETYGTQTIQSPDSSLPISLELSTHYWDHQDPTENYVNQLRHPNAALARRSVSCITSQKCNETQVDDTRAVATLPSRNDHRIFGFAPPTQDTSAAYLTSIGTHNTPLPVRLPDSYSNDCTSLSPDSSHTATSSGVALTAGSSSGGATRPSSLAISHWPPTVMEEETHLEHDLDPSNNNSLVEHQPARTNKDRPVSVATSVPTMYQAGTTGFVTVPNNQDRTVSEQYSCRPPRLAWTAEEDNSRNCDDHSATSLVLLAAQLEEIQKEKHSLRSRRKTLSFRISDRMVVDSPDSRDTQAISTVSNQSLGDVSAAQTVTTTSSANTTAELCSNYLSDLNEPRAISPNVRQQDEAMSSLCARLAAVELLIEQADLTEAHVRKKLEQCLMDSTVDSPESMPTVDRSETADVQSVPVKQQMEKVNRAVASAAAQVCVNGMRGSKRGRRHRGYSHQYQLQNGAACDLEPTLSPSDVHRGGRRGGRHRRPRRPFGVSNQNRSNWTENPLTSPRSERPITLSPVT